MDNYAKNVGNNKMRQVKNVDNLLITCGQLKMDEILPPEEKYRDKKAVKCDIAGRKVLDMGIMLIILILIRPGVVPELKKKDGDDGRNWAKTGGDAVR